MKGWSPYISSLVQTVMCLSKTDIEFDFWNLSGDSYVDRARNHIAKKFLDSDFTHLFFIDSDHSWKIESFLNILKHDEDIVAAGYPCKNNWNFYGCVLETQPGYDPIRDEAGNITHVGPARLNENGLAYAIYAPTGFMKIRRNVFEQLSKSCSMYSYKDELFYDFFGRIPPLGEDSSFCKRWRDIGGEIFVELDCDISHYGVKEYAGNYLNFLKGQPVPIQSRGSIPWNV